MRRVGELAVVLCTLAFVVMLYGCGSSGGPAGPGEGAAGKPPSGGGQYYVTALPKSAGSATYVEAISDENGGGVWIGGAEHTDAGTTPAVWRVTLPSPGGEPTIQKTLLGAQGVVNDINQYGRAVGSDTPADSAFYYDGSSLHFLQDSSSYTYANGIGTDFSTVRIAAYGTSGALVWEFPFGSLPDPENPATWTVLPGFDGQPSGQPYTSTEDICDSDPSGVVRIVGRVYDPTPESQFAVMWARPAGDGFGLPVRMAPEPAYPKEVNRGGQAVGQNHNNWRDAWLWQEGTLTVLPWIKGKWSDHNAYGTNDAGVVVGYARYQVGLTVKAVKAVVWRGGQAADLNSLVTVSGGLTGAYDINNSGMIVAVGPGSDGKTNAYLLRPK